MAQFGTSVPFAEVKCQTGLCTGHLTVELSICTCSFTRKEERFGLETSSDEDSSGSSSSVSFQRIAPIKIFAALETLSQVYRTFVNERLLLYNYKTSSKGLVKTVAGLLAVNSREMGIELALNLENFLQNCAEVQLESFSDMKALALGIEHAKTVGTFDFSKLAVRLYVGIVDAIVVK